MYYQYMTTRQRMLEDLKALVAEKKTRQRSIRIPVSIDKEIEQLAKQTGADYTDALLVLLEAGVEVLKGKEPGKK